MPSVVRAGTKLALSLAALIGSIGSSSPALATGAYIVTDATITNIINTSSNGTTFVLTTTGGAGPCANTNIYFPLANSADAATFARAYASALSALAMNLRVTIYNYTDSTCMTASYIDIHQ